jgi:two-component system, OmpR family, KDP operon response regulator KdpE
MGSSVQTPEVGIRKVLLVADAPRSGLAAALNERPGLECVGSEPHSHLDALYAEQPDVVLIDCGGLEQGYLGRIYTLRLVSEVPIMALVEEGAKAGEAVAMGADAVCVMPISCDELDTRIGRLIYRTGPVRESHLLVEGPVRVDRLGHSVTCSGREIALTETEFRMLVVFAQRPGHALGHSELVELVWRDPYRGREEVKLYVSYLRRKFREMSVDPFETVRGIGYRYRPRPVVT